jgi:MoxR-like ATPase
MSFKSIGEIEEALAQYQYITDPALATTLYLAQALKKPMFLEGEAGVGKTEVAKVLAKVLDTRLIRLQCYEGLDAYSALYEWNYPKQLLRIKLEENAPDKAKVEQDIFGPEFLIRRPLLEAIQPGNGHQGNGAKPPVLLIDEVDRADSEFEAFLLEVLSDFQITIPEIGTIKAVTPPLVVLTSNRTREIHDALKRRCLYLWIDYPTFEKEYRIVTTRLPHIEAQLTNQICKFMQALRVLDLFKKPGIAETLDWAAALITLHQDYLAPETVEATLGCILKYQEDVVKVKQENIQKMLEQIGVCVT